MKYDILPKSSIILLLSVIILFAPFRTDAQSIIDNVLGNPLELIRDAAARSVGCFAAVKAAGLVETGTIGGAGIALNAATAVPVSDAAANVLQAQDTAEKNAKDCIFDTGADVIKNSIIQALREDIRQWAYSGFDGKPAFLDSDRTEFFENVGDRVLTYYEQDGNAFAQFLCQPFIGTIQARITSSRSSFQPTCSVDEIGSNLQAVVDQATDNIENFENYISFTENNPIYSIWKAELDIDQQARSLEESVDQRIDPTGTITSIVEDCEPTNRSGGDEAPDPFGVGALNEILAFSNCTVQALPNQISGLVTETVFGSDLSQVEDVDDFPSLIGLLLSDIISETINGTIDRTVKGLRENTGGGGGDDDVTLSSILGSDDSDSDLTAEQARYYSLLSQIRRINEIELKDVSDRQAIVNFLNLEILPLVRGDIPSIYNDAGDSCGYDRQRNRRRYNVNFSQLNTIYNSVQEHPFIGFGIPYTIGAEQRTIDRDLFIPRIQSCVRRNRNGVNYHPTAFRDAYVNLFSGLDGWISVINTTLADDATRERNREINFESRNSISLSTALPQDSINQSHVDKLVLFCRAIENDIRDNNFLSRQRQTDFVKETFNLSKSFFDIYRNILVEYSNPANDAKIIALDSSTTVSINTNQSRFGAYVSDTANIASQVFSECTEFNSRADCTCVADLSNIHASGSGPSR